MEIKRTFKSSNENDRKENLVKIIRRFMYSIKNSETENK